MRVIRQQIIRNSIWGNLNIFVRYGLSFLATAIIAGNYGPEAFGTYQLSLVYLAVLDLVTFLNPTHIRNYLIRNPQKKDEVVVAWVVHHILLSLIICSAVIFCWWCSDFSLVYTLLFYSMGKIFLKIWDYSQIVLDAELRSDLVQKIQIVSIATFNTSRGLFALLKMNPMAISSATLIQTAVTVWYQILLFRQDRVVKWEKISLWYLIDLIRSGWILSIVAFLVGIQNRIITLMLAESMPLVEFGNFQLILRLIEPATMTATVLFTANYTTLASTYVLNKYTFLKRFGKISILAMLVSILSSGFLLLVPVDMWVKIFGEHYRSGLQYLWMSSSIVFSSVLFSLSIYIDTISIRYLSTCIKTIIVILTYVIIFKISPEPITISKAIFLHSVVPIMVSFLFLPFDIYKFKNSIRR